MLSAESKKRWVKLVAGINWRSVAWFIAIFFVVGVLILPTMLNLVVQHGNPVPPSIARLLVSVQYTLSIVVNVFYNAWFFFLGATFASFLNVVAQRVPRGRSIVGPSRCPHCNVAIRFSDNIPIFGWLKNNGRCSACHLPISVRYLLVEILLGSIFVGVVNLYLLNGGSFLPFRVPDEFSTISNMYLMPKSDLLHILSFHLLAILNLFTVVLIELKKERIPLSLFWVGGSLLILFLIVQPNVLLFDIRFPYSRHWPLARMDAIVSFFGAGMIGFCCGQLFQGKRKIKASGFTFGLTIIGACFGWPSLLLPIIFFFLLKLLDQTIEKKLPCNAALLFGTLLNLLVWKFWDRFF